MTSTMRVIFSKCNTW